MRPTVYIDVLFFINLLINLILLYVSAKLLSLKLKPLRFLIASVLGALYSVLIFFPDFNVFYSGSAKFLSSFAIVAIAFNIKGWRLYFKTLGVFYLVTLLFGGCVFALFYLSGIGSRVGAVIKNGVIYFDLPWQFLFFSIGISYIIISGIWKSILSRSKGNSFIILNIEYSGSNAIIRALLDTGNSLFEPISHSPVIVTEFSEIKKILPAGIRKAVESGDLNFEESVKIRVIPFSSVGKENGLLLGFQPDRVTATVNEQQYEIENVIIGISPTSLSKDKSFQALINPAVISGI